VLIVPELEEYEALDKLRVRDLEIEVVRRGERGLERVKRVLKEIKPRILGVEGSITKKSIEEIAREVLPKSRIMENIKDIGDILSDLRKIKEEAEIHAIKEATRVAIEALEEVLSEIKAGMREAEVAAALVSKILERGAKIAFEPIVASGPRAAYPHGGYSRRKIRKGEVVLIDVGARVHGYCSDITRALLVGEVPSEIKRSVEAVERALEAGIKSVREGVEACKPDMQARELLSREGLGKYFIHNLGHGVGVEVHEGPRIGPGSKEVLRGRMVVTIEPGIYIKDKAGVRIEELVLVTESGCEILSRGIERVIRV